MSCFLILVLWILSFEVFLEESLDCLGCSEVSEKISDEDDELSEKSGSEGIFQVPVKRDVSSWKFGVSLFCDKSSFGSTPGLSVILDLTDDVPSSRLVSSISVKSETIWLCLDDFVVKSIYHHL